MGTRRHSYARTQAGQTLVLMALFLAFLMIPLGLAVLALNAQRDAVTELGALVQDAALAAALAIDEGSLATGARLDSGRATAVARAALRRGFATFGQRIDAATAAEEATVTVLNASAGNPGSDPDGGAVYHHPTICLSDDVAVGVLVHNGLTFTHHLHACAQIAVP